MKLKKTVQVIKFNNNINKIKKFCQSKGYTNIEYTVKEDSAFLYFKGMMYAIILNKGDLLVYDTSKYQELYQSTLENLKNDGFR